MSSETCPRFVIRERPLSTRRLPGRFTLLLLALVVAGDSGCSFRQFAVNRVGNALAGGGSTFSSEDDPELVKAAAPFSLKLMESLLSEAPHHQKLLLAASSGFTQYAYAFVQEEAEETEERDVLAGVEQRRRARRLYLRARDYALRGLEVSHHGFTRALEAEPKSAVSVLTRKDVPFAYWGAVSWVAAIGVIKNDTDLIAHLPQVEALIGRALELDEGYDSGAIHSFLISYEMARPQSGEKAAAAARGHFERAVQLSRGEQAGPFVNLAEAVAVTEQNRAEFENLLNHALAIRPEARPEWRLMNVIMQRRARRLLNQEENLIASDAK